MRLLAEEGPAALERWLKEEEQQDVHIRARVEALRERLDRDARGRRRELQERHEEEKGAVRSTWERRMQETAERERALQERLAETEGPIRLSQEDLLASGPRLRSSGDTARPRWRLRTWLRRVWVFLVSLWVRLVRKVRGGAPRQPGTVVVLPEGTSIDLAGLGPDTVLSLQEESGSWRDRWRRLRDRLLGREDHLDAARRRLEQQAHEMRQERERARAEERRRVQEELERLRRQETEQAQKRDGEEQAVTRRHRRESEELAASAEQAPYQELRRELLGELEAAGLVDETGRITRSLVERFGNLLYEQARRSIPGTGHATPGTYVEGEGEYEVGPLRSLHEIGAIDLTQSLVRSRIRHPQMRHLYDEDVVVHREVRTERSHLVIVFDTSGSMEEQGRLEAAKRVCLVLWRAVKERNPEHRVDLLKMETGVEAVDLADCWNATPAGFTNHGEAFRQAARLFEAEGADRKTLYVVTDGLPEAWTGPDGVDRADRADVCMRDALQKARPLRSVAGLHTVILQLETRNRQYLRAAHRLAEAAGGRVEGVDPRELVEWMMTDYETAQVQAA